MTWRLVTEHIATLQEIHTVYSLDDILDAHLALDMQAEIDYQRNKETPTS